MDSISEDLIDEATIHDVRVVRLLRVDRGRLAPFFSLGPYTEQELLHGVELVLNMSRDPSSFIAAHSGALNRMSSKLDDICSHVRHIQQLLHLQNSRIPKASMADIR